MNRAYTPEQDRPVYEQLREYLSRDIESGKLLPGDKISPENELENRFHVSRTTIRRVLHGLEREGMILRFPGKGTFISSKPSPEIQPDFTVGINFLTQLSSDSYHSRLADGVLTQAGKYNIRIQMLPAAGQADPETFANISGVLFQGLLDKNTPLYRKISKGLLPAVGFNSRISNACSYIGIDNEKEVYNAVSLLKREGYKSIGFYGSAPAIPGSVAENRFRGYCKALEEYAPGLNRKHIHFHTPHVDRRIQALEFLRSAGKEMDALFVSLSPVLTDVLYALNVLRMSVQEDLKILCFDNLEDRFLNWPSISYIRMPLEKIGARMLSVLRQHLILKDKAPVIHEIFPAELIHSRN